MGVRRLLSTNHPLTLEGPLGSFPNSSLPSSGLIPWVSYRVGGGREELCARTSCRFTGSRWGGGGECLSGRPDVGARCLVNVAPLGHTPGLRLPQRHVVWCCHWCPGNGGRDDWVEGVSCQCAHCSKVTRDSSLSGLVDFSLKAHETVGNGDQHSILGCTWVPKSSVEDFTPD